MPDQDRKPSGFLSQGPEDGARCPICPGLIGASFQADCVCCGRQVAACTTQQPDSKADLTEAIKALSIKSGAAPQVSSSSSQSDAQDSHLHPACPRISNRRHSATPVLRSSSSSDQRPGGGAGGTTSPDVQLARGGGSRNAAIRICKQPQYVVQPVTSSRRGPSRGSSASSSKGAGRGVTCHGVAHRDFKGVRTRKGVKGFLVEIRPPKWKKTIWLGTYNTSIEAAGAYDAGVFYTKKSNTKYNFHSSEGAFPPLPPHLHLDRADNMDEIKLFVQNQAREAARRMGSIAMGTTTTTTPTDASSVHEPTSSESCITGDSSVISVDGADDDDLPSMDSSPQELVEIDSQFQIPMDLDYLGQFLNTDIAEETAKDMFLDYTNYLSQHGAALDQELEEEEDDQFITS